MKRGRGEHGLKPLAGKRHVLKLGVHKLHLASTFQVPPGQRYEARAGFECCDVQAPSEKAARQLAASTPNLKHMIAAPDPRHLTSLVDEFVRICRTAAVVLSRDLIENHAVTTGSGFWLRRHSLAAQKRARSSGSLQSMTSWNRAGIALPSAQQWLGRSEVYSRASPGDLQPYDPGPGNNGDRDRLPGNTRAALRDAVANSSTGRNRHADLGISKIRLRILPDHR